MGARQPDRGLAGLAPMSVVVTGASGHVGANLIRSLIGSGRRVRAMIHNERLGLDGLDIDYVEGDVRDPDSLVKAFDGAEIVFHLAAMISISGDHGGRVQAINVRGVRNVAEAALEVGARRMVHVSSIHAFGLDDRSAPLDETRPPRTPGRSSCAGSSTAASTRRSSTPRASSDPTTTAPRGWAGCSSSSTVAASRP